jgi:hypothetical protein
MAMTPAGQRGTVRGRYCVPRSRQGVALGRLEREHMTECTVTGCIHQPSNHGPESHGAPPLCGGRDEAVPAFIARPQPTTCRRRGSSRSMPPATLDPTTHLIRPAELGLTTTGDTGACGPRATGMLSPCSSAFSGGELDGCHGLSAAALDGFRGGAAQRPGSRAAAPLSKGASVLQEAPWGRCAPCRERAGRPLPPGQDLPSPLAGHLWVSLCLRGRGTR